MHKKTNQKSAATASAFKKNTLSSAASPVEQAKSATPTVFKDEDVNVMVHELAELRKKSPEGLESVFFCKSNFAMAVVTPKGGCISFSNDSISLDIPPKAVKEDQVLYIYRPVRIHVTANSTEPAGPPPSIIAYAPTVHCGPVGAKFDIPAILQFGHCAVYDPAKGPSGLFAMRRKTETSSWEAMRPEQFDVSAKYVKVRLDVLCQCTLGYPLRKES